MPCYHPLKAFHIGVNAETGKNRLKVVPYGVDHLELAGDRWIYADAPAVKKAAGVRYYIEYDVIPCGQCIGCRLEHSRQWADRCMIEASQHKFNWWLTLTYDDDHLPSGTYLNDETGETGISHSLNKRDVQLFIKRLRNAGFHFKYFGCGEYGDFSSRPHYHLLIFSDNMQLHDLTFYKRAGDYLLYNSDTISDFWRVQKPKGQPVERLGFVVVAQVSYKSCAYTARYVCKKLTGSKAQVYHDYNLLPEFAMMSSRPAIAREWFLENKDSMDFNNLIFSTVEGAKRIHMPKYYVRLLESFDPEDLTYSSINDLRKSLAEQRQKWLEASSDRDLLAILEAEENSKLSQIKSLRRCL